MLLTRDSFRFLWKLSQDKMSIHWHRRAHLCNLEKVMWIILLMFQVSLQYPWVLTKNTKHCLLMRVALWFNLPSLLKKLMPHMVWNMVSILLNIKKTIALFSRYWLDIRGEQFTDRCKSVNERHKRRFQKSFCRTLVRTFALWGMCSDNRQVCILHIVWTFISIGEDRWKQACQHILIPIDLCRQNNESSNSNFVFSSSISLHWPSLDGYQCSHMYVLVTLGLQEGILHFDYCDKKSCGT